MFSIDHFKHGTVKFTVHSQPVSLKSKSDSKAKLKKEIQKKTSESEFIVTGHCWVSIDYYCKQTKRYKNPGAYDIDNIVKPILDSFVGKGGLLIDDSLADRVTVNWIDTHGEDYIIIEVEHPDLLFLSKTDLLFIKSENGWCWPSTQKLINSPEVRDLAQLYFGAWDRINTEEEFNEWIWCLPIQPFIYHNKLKSEGYEFISLADISDEEKC